MTEVASDRAREVFSTYARERRTQTIDAFHLDVLPGYSRYTPRRPGMSGFITFTDLDEREALDRIRVEKAYFTALGIGFEWKVYALDRPASMMALLEGEGFVASPIEAFLVAPVERAIAAPRSQPGLRIERIEDPARLRDVVMVQEAVWGRSHPWLEPVMDAALRLRPDTIAITLAWLDDRPVGTGWVDLIPGSSFGDLHGGAVVEDARGRGVYSALLAARGEIARQRGYRYLAVDAAPMSRPILERKGFEFVCHTWPLRIAAPGAAADGA